jgi:plasmid stabilization system protein ParE
MDRKINFSTEATKRTEEIIRYLSGEWSVSAALNFTNKLNGKIRNIQLFPKSY